MKTLFYISRSLRAVRAPPLSTVSKFVAIGLNYRAHTIEANLLIPDEPVAFFKVPGCINGSDDDIVIPPHSTKLDGEAEPGIVITRAAKEDRTVTPVGAGPGMKPDPIWLKAGDNIRVHIEKPGYQNQPLKR